MESNKQLKILFVVPRRAWPNYAGQARLSYFRARELKTMGHQVDLMYYTYDKTQLTSEQASYLRDVYSNIYDCKTPFLDIASTFMSAIYSWLILKRSLLCYIFTPKTIEKNLEEIARSNEYNIIHFYSLRTYSLWKTAIPSNTKVLIDLIDSMSLNFTELLNKSKYAERFLITRELSAIKKVESNLTIFPNLLGYLVVSDKDKAWLSLDRKWTHLSNDKIYTSSIGVDLAINVSKDLVKQHDVHNLVFFGSLSYKPNIHASFWLLKHIAPNLKSISPDLMLNFIGSRPSKQLKSAIEKFDCCKLTPDPLDINEFLSQCSILVAPIFSGSGQQFKIIEAMSLNIAVIASSKACESLNLVHGEHVLIANDKSEYLESIRELLFNHDLKNKLLRNSRKLVYNSYSWSRLAAELIRIYNL